MKNSLPEVNEISVATTSMFKVKIQGYGIFNREFEKYIYDLKSKTPNAKRASNRGGWHSPDLNFNDQPVLKFINKSKPILKGICSYLNWDLENFSLEYASIWSIINEKYSYNLVHNHGDAILSLAYYVIIPKIDGGDFFINFNTG